MMMFTAMVTNHFYSPLGFQPIWGILKPLMSVCACVRVCVCPWPTVAQRWLDGFIWYFAAWWPISLGWCPSFRILKKIKIGNFMAVFHNFILGFQPWYQHIQTQCSEMAGWILMKLCSNMHYIPGMISVFTEFEKNKNWRFYGNISGGFPLDLIWHVDSMFGVYRNCFFSWLSVCFNCFMCRLWLYCMIQLFSLKDHNTLYYMYI